MTKILTPATAAPRVRAKLCHRHCCRHSTAPLPNANSYQIGMRFLSVQSSVPSTSQCYLRQSGRPSERLCFMSNGLCGEAVSTVSWDYALLQASHRQLAALQKWCTEPVHVCDFSPAAAAPLCCCPPWPSRRRRHCHRQFIWMMAGALTVCSAVGCRVGAAGDSGRGGGGAAGVGRKCP